MAGATYTVSVGAMRDERVACLVFHKLPEDAAAALKAALAGTAGAPPLIDRRSGGPETGAPETGKTPDAGSTAEPAASADGGPRTSPEAAPLAAALREPPAAEAPHDDPVRDDPTRDYPARDGPVRDDEIREDEARDHEVHNDEVRGTALFRAIHSVRRLVADTAVMLMSDDEERDGNPAGFVDASEAELVRLVLLTIATRGDPRAVLKVRREGETIVVEAPSAPERALERLAESDRIADIASEACRSVCVSMRGIVRIEPARTGEDGPQKAVDLVR